MLTAQDRLVQSKKWRQVVDFVAVNFNPAGC